MTKNCNILYTQDMPHCHIAWMIISLCLLHVADGKRKPKSFANYATEFCCWLCPALWNKWWDAWSAHSHPGHVCWPFLGLLAICPGQNKCCCIRTRNWRIEERESCVGWPAAQPYTCTGLCPAAAACVVSVFSESPCGHSATPNAFFNCWPGQMLLFLHWEIFLCLKFNLFYLKYVLVYLIP